MISYKNCTMCPRSCGVDRSIKKGFCREDDKPKVAWCGLHKGEEMPISGKNGSGMFFFTGCSLGCKYCQNYQISLNNENFKNAVTLSIVDAVKIAEEFKKNKAQTISLVTAEHWTPFVLDFLKELKLQNINLPIVYNTSGWISKEVISALLPYIDIWLWDTKTLDRSVAKEFCGSENYPSFEEESFKYLYDNIKEFDLENTSSGIIVRHLIFPSSLDDSKAVIENFCKYKDKCYFSLMAQFDNPFKGNSPHFDKITKKEYEELVNLIFDKKIENGFLQEIADEDEWMPDFNLDNPFSKHGAVASKYFLSLRANNTSAV